MSLLLVFLLFLSCSPAFSEVPKPALKPILASYQKPVLENIFEKKQSSIQAGWNDQNFDFITAALVHSSIKQAAASAMNFDLYPQMTSAIKKIHFDPKSKILEIVGEAGGFRMHSFLEVTETSWKDKSLDPPQLDTERIDFKIVRGDMKGMLVQAFLFDYQGKTFMYAKGNWPGGRKKFSGLMANLFKLVSEQVIGVATTNFRSYIEGEYKKNKLKPNS